LFQYKVLNNDKIQHQHLFCFQASMLTSPDGPFINLARLDMAKYATKPALAKALFEYIFHHENDVRNVSRQNVCT